MLSFANTQLSFYLLFLLCMASIAASAPTTTYHRHLPSSSSSFPYGKLADKLLNVNDVSYMIDDLDEDMVRVYPENHSIIPLQPTYRQLWAKATTTDQHYYTDCRHEEPPFFRLSYTGHHRKSRCSRMGDCSVSVASDAREL